MTSLSSECSSMLFPIGADAISASSSSAAAATATGLGDFVDGNLGPGQIVGRNILGASCIGEIQLSMCVKGGGIEVEVVRARGLRQPRPGAKTLPAPYVKVYLMEGKTVFEKHKTKLSSRKTLDPLYQQQLTFAEPYRGKILQVSIWGEYSRIDRKVFMGVAQIRLDDLDLSNIVIGWYKLFTVASLVTAAAGNAVNGSGGGGGVTGGGGVGMTTTSSGVGIGGGGPSRGASMTSLDSAYSGSRS